jgi:hypothetical protein
MAARAIGYDTGCCVMDLKTNLTIADIANSPEQENRCKVMILRSQLSIKNELEKKGGN